MISRLPIAAAPVPAGTILAAFLRQGSGAGKFQSALAGYTGAKYIFPVNSGIAAFYLALSAFRQRSRRREVILPAYTAGSLVVAVRKAGLKPVLCDVNLRDFNLDLRLLPDRLSGNTLAVNAVHLFGIGLSGITGMRGSLPPEVFLIEDCAQAMGAVVDGKPVGLSGDIGFFSFNRGKNLTVGGGGCLVTGSDRLARELEPFYQDLPTDGFGAAAKMLLKNLAFSLAMRPGFYGPGNRFLARFRENVPPEDFACGRLSGFESALGLALLRTIAAVSRRRFLDGMFLMDGLRNVNGITLPEFPAGDRPAFNRFPFLVHDLRKKKQVRDLLSRNGLETSEMYLNPLHRMFDLGCDPDAFPAARYLADHLLALPSHPAVGRRNLARMVGLIGDVMESKA